LQTSNISRLPLCILFSSSGSVRPSPSQHSCRIRPSWKAI